jgi:selenocysteine-specific elongation factor
MKHLILATAGHVDHGKSSLVLALTGTDPDRLPEEKARGITIVPGFAELNLTGPGGDAIHLGIVDVPGHEDFIRNMVAGVGSVDVALLVVAANEGWKAQTQEHVEILSHLGVARGVVALTKADLVDDLAGAMAKVRSRLERTPLAAAPIVPTATGRADLLDGLKRVLGEVCSQTPAPPDAGKPQLFVDRVFTSPGAGTIATGTLSGGTMAGEGRVVIQPRGLSARIRVVQNHGREVAEVGPGQRVALNLAEVAIASRRGADGVKRGDVVTLPGMGLAQLCLDVELRRSECVGERPAKLRNGAMVVMHHGSSAHQARVMLIDVEELAAGASALARLTFTEPVFALAGDHFVIRDSSARATLAGGVVLDANPPAKLSAEQLALLRVRRGAPLSPERFLESALVRDHWCLPAEALVQSRFSAAETRSAAEKLERSGAILLRNDHYVGAGWWREQCERAVSEIDAVHRAHPDYAGLELSKLRSKLALPAKLQDALVAELCAGEFVQSGSAIARKSHELALPPALQPAGARIRAALAKEPFEPPSRKQLAADSTSVQALAYLIRRRLVVEIGPDLVMETGAYRAAAEAVLARLRTSGAMGASELRELLGTNRRVIIPLLERMDRDGLTRRVGDKRVAR